MSQTQAVHIPEPLFAKHLFANTSYGWIWLIIRVYVGWSWFIAGWEKLESPVWVGAKAGVAVQGFVTGALSKTSGLHPDVTGWYADFLNGFVTQHAVGFSYMVTYGEILVGVALILGIFTGIAAFFGSFMNMNFLLAGTVSVNPILLFLQLFLILAWRVAGWVGLDRYILPMLGTPWRPGKVF
ncbi:MAG: DoxX family membrane protein [Candidatus Doudnabacteria bacterium]